MDAQVSKKLARIYKSTHRVGVDFSCETSNKKLQDAQLRSHTANRNPSRVDIEPYKSLITKNSACLEAVSSRLAVAP